MVVCVTDFGVSKMMTQEMSKAAGTPMYMSPEIINGGAYSFSADTYSFAFIVWELFARKLPYGDMIPWEITKGVCESGLRPEPLNDPIDVLTDRCWAQAPQKRPTFAAILEYLKTLQSNLRLNGEAAFAEACRSKLMMLDVEDKPPVTPGSKFTDKVRRLTGTASMGAAMGTPPPAHASPASSSAGSLPLSVPKSPSQSSDLGEHPLSPGLSSKTILNLLPVRKTSPGSAEQRKSDRDRTNSTGSLSEPSGPSAGGTVRRKSDNGSDAVATPPKKSGSSTFRSDKVDL